MFRAKTLIAMLMAVSAARGDTIILKNGGFVEGEIVLETSRSIRVNTRYGQRTYRRNDIREIIESVDSLDPDAVNRFADLPAAVKAVLNARAEYDLGRYEQALARLQPFRGFAENRAIRIRMDWLTIEINERLGKWDVARSLLDKKLHGATPQEEIRAAAHLALFDRNPAFNLRYVGRKHARNFIVDDELQREARQPGALESHKIMRIALEETCEQLLVEDEMSVKAFADKLDLEATYQACQRLPATGDIGRHLPYIDDLKHAEGAIAKAQAILGDYGAAFELDLVRTELNHLQAVSERLLDRAMEMSPEDFEPSFDASTGRLTKEGRRQWRDRCDEFLTRARPLTKLLNYMLDRVSHNPHALRDLRKTLTEANDRYKQMVKAVKRARNRTHA